jgi:transketolase
MLGADAQTTTEWREFCQKVQESAPVTRAALLRDRAQQTRREVLQIIRRAGLGHIGGDFSVTDLLTVLYHGVLHIDPEHPNDPERDRFILSKGHCAVSFYTTLASCGFFPSARLTQFAQPDSDLSGHPNRRYTPGVETNTGPLGHGLPVAVGAAIGLQHRHSSARVFVITGDGELQEGSNWEALMCASHQRLSNLTVIVDRNLLQQGARTEETTGLEPLHEKLSSFGCEVSDVDGHDHKDLYELLSARPVADRPRAIIAHTVKGKGVSFMEDRVEWHHKVPNAEQAERAVEELV